ncbi:unnamed protein product [Lampetra planeri]
MSSDHMLNTLEPEYSTKWRKYLQLKQHFYMAYAYCYHGQTLLASDKYFHKVPADAPQLELKASYGLAEAIPFELPALSDKFTAEVYATFDLTKGSKMTR